MAFIPPVVMAAAPYVVAGLSALSAGIVALVQLFKKRPSNPAPVPDRVLEEFLQQKTEFEELKRKLEHEMQIKHEAESAKQKAVDLEKKKREKIVREILDTFYRKSRDIGVDAENCCNIGFAGSRGVGKSTLINALRGKKKGDPDYAKCNIKEQKIDGGMAPYKYLDTNVLLWDIEGGETKDVPAATYYDDKCLYMFDSIILLFHDKFGEFELQLLACVLRDNVDVRIVRTKSEVDISSLLLESDEVNGDINRAVEYLRRDTLQYVNNELIKDGITSKQRLSTYNISSRVMSKQAASPEIDEKRFVSELFNKLKDLRYSEGGATSRPTAVQRVIARFPALRTT